MVAATIDLRKVVKHLAPSSKIRGLAWAEEHGRLHDGTPYCHNDNPYFGNPGGPWDAVNDPRVQTIILQLATRLGKTTFFQFMQQYFADVSPGPGMFANADEKLAVEGTARWYEMAEHNKRLKHLLRPPRERRQNLIVLPAMKIYVAWARSVATLADKAVRYGHAGEIDKWEHESTSDEADPLELFFERGKQYRRRKFGIESSPTVRGKSRVESARLRSTNCLYNVPCPHCKHYQSLKLGNGKTPYGIKWDKLDNGRHDADLARSTAYYECEHCHEKIRDEHRAWMMRRGVWCPEGCAVNSLVAIDLFDARGRTSLEWKGWTSAPWIIGVPLRNGPEAGYQLSSLYHLKLTWGDIAAKKVSVQNNPIELRNFINSWLAETWEESGRKVTWQLLGARIIDKDLRAGVAPLWASMLTAGFDRQADGRLPWVIDAWGPEERCATIGYGEATDFDALFQQVVARTWRHEDGGPIEIVCGLFDSGYMPTGVNEFCIRCRDAGYNIWPSKGSSTPMPSDYDLKRLDEDTANPGMEIHLIDTERSQSWIEEQLTNEKWHYRLYHGSLGEHERFLLQLLNDAVFMDPDKSNVLRRSWRRLSRDIPNDMRDCRRNARVAKIIWTGGADAPPRGYVPPPPEPDYDDEDDGPRVRRMNRRR